MKAPALTCLLAICLSATVFAEPGTEKPVTEKTKKAVKPAKFSATHPFYRSALRDLRTARWMIYHHPRNWQPTVDEGKAIGHIDAAIAAINKASIDDGKTIKDKPKLGKARSQQPRLNVALDCLRQARINISRDGGKNLPEGLQLRTYEQIDGAVAAVRQTLKA